MLLFFVILFSLLASVSTSSEDVESELSQKRLDKYNYFVPKMCTSASATTFTSNEIAQIFTEDQHIKNNCVAIIRFHGYNDKWVHVVMESRDTKRVPPVSKIVLHRNGNPWFSCENENGELVAYYESLRHLAKITIEESSLNPLKCVFEVHLRGAKDNFPQNDDSVTYEMEINKDESSNERTSSSNLPYFRFGEYCNPDQLKFSRSDPDQEKEYSKVKYSAGSMSCESGFDTEYRVVGQEKFEPAILTCKLKEKTFETNGGNKIPKTEDIEIRCAGSARYSCSYQPKCDPSVIYIPSERAIPPAKSIPGEVKCKDGEFMFVRGKYAPGRIECRNQEFSMLWVHIPDKGNETILHKTSPSIECKTEIDCKTSNPIKHVKKGKLINHVPQCFNEGTLQLNGMPVKNVTCDGRTGRYMATLIEGGTKTQVEDNAHFVCDYPPDKGKEENEKDQKSIAIMIGGIIGAFFLALIVGGVFVKCFVDKKADREIAQKKKEAKELWKQFGDKNAKKTTGTVKGGKRKKIRKEKIDKKDKIHSAPLPERFEHIKSAPYLKKTQADIEEEAKGTNKTPGYFVAKRPEFTEGMRTLLVKRRGAAVAEKEIEDIMNMIVKK